MREIRKLNVFFLVVAATLALSTAGASAAHKRAHKQAASSISLDSLSADGFSGRVSSAKQACLGQRDVTIYMVNSNSRTWWTSSSGSSG